MMKEQKRWFKNRECIKYGEKGYFAKVYKKNSKVVIKKKVNTVKKLPSKSLDSSLERDIIEIYEKPMASRSKLIDHASLS